MTESNVTRLLTFNTPVTILDYQIYVDGTIVLKFKPDYYEKGNQQNDQDDTRWNETPLA